MGPISLSRDALDEATLAGIASDCGLPVEAIEDVCICSPLQIATMIETTLRSGSSIFQFVFDLGPNVDGVAFSKAVQEVVARNSILRTRIVEGSTLGTIQVILKEEFAEPCRILNDDLDLYLGDMRKKRMDMGCPLFIAAILQHKLVLSMHHAVMDHSALTLLMTDAVAAYHGQSPSPRKGYQEFVDHCYSVTDEEVNRFWGSRFKGAPVIFPTLPSGHLPLASEAFEQRIIIDSKVPDEAVTHIASFTEAALGMTLASYTGSDSVAIGLVLAGRNGLPADLSSTLGPTIATVPLQINVSTSSTVSSVVKERTSARRELQSNSALHAGMPRIREASEASRAASQFQTILNIRPSLADSDAASAEVAFEQMHEPDAPFVLCLSCNLMPDCRSMILETRFDPQVLTQRRARILVNQFEHSLNTLMLTSWYDRLKALPALNSHDRQQILEWNSSSGVQVRKTLHEMFREKTLELPHTTAIEATVGGTVTYRELDDISSRLARELQGKGVERGSRVPFIFDKSLWTIVAMLAILKAGAACVPIERTNPRERRADLVRSVGARTVLTSSSEQASNVDIAENVIAVDQLLLESLPGSPDTNDVSHDPASCEDLAVVLFTSGSTGKPKGVMLEHQNLASSLTAMSDQMGWSPGRRILQFAAHVWDMSLGEIFGALLFGGCLCIPSEEQRSSGLSQYIQDSWADWTILTPTVLRTLSPDDIPSLRTVISAGEAISGDIISAWGKSSKLCLLNGWGPSETSVISAIGEVTANSPYPDSIGLPVGCSIWLANSDRIDELVSIGSAGEICVAGPGVARGYLDEKSSNNGFIKPPAWAPSYYGSPHRVFRTGDLARYNDDGSITFIGRRDNQVKVRGQRFDLGELEAIIMASGHARGVYTTTKIQAGRTEVVAVLGTSRDVHSGIVGIEPLKGERADRFASSMAAVKSYTASKLPAYMIPTIWIATEELPRTTSTKLDRTAVCDWLKTQDLSSIKWSTLDTPLTITAPSTVNEKVVQEIWAKVLSLQPEEIGRESVFLKIGGDSIRAMQAANLSQKKGLNITTVALLRDQTLASVAAAEQPSRSDRQEWWLDLPEKDQSVTLPSDHRFGMQIELVVPATDAQASMLAVGQKRKNGYHVAFELDFEPALDTHRLQAACEAVIRHHSVIRTVFIQYKSRLYQAVLGQAAASDLMKICRNGEKLPAFEDFPENTPLARFYLLTDGTGCHSLLLHIHHALYDAFSLNLLFKDLEAAYTGTDLSKGPTYHAWVSYCNQQNIEQSLSFWRARLEGSHMSYLVPSLSGLSLGLPLTESLKFCTKLSVIEKLSRKPATIIKSAWALLLSFALQQRDVVFGEVSIGRLAGPPGIEQVRGPCVNTVPVRAKMDPEQSLESIVAQLHTLAQESIAHQHVGSTKIIQKCTDWPGWTRFGSVLVYQSAGMLEESFKIGDTHVKPSHEGELGDSADIYVIATPQSTADELQIEINSAPGMIPAQQGEWMIKCFKAILEAISTRPEQALNDLYDSLEQTIGSYMGPPQRAISHQIDIETTLTKVSAELLDVVGRGWKEVGLLHKTYRSANDSINDDEGVHKSTMADCGADITTVLLLSKYYSRHGYDASVEELVHHPTRSLQASLWEEKATA